VADTLPAALDFLAPSVVPNLLRVGNWKDGGYIVPYPVIAAAQALISCGINREWSFEEDFRAINPRATIHGYDHTVSERILRRQFRRGLLGFAIGRVSRAEAAQRFWLWKEFSAFFGSKARHFEEKIVAEDAHRAGEATLDRAFSRIGTAHGDIILKIDIEGDEYGIIDTILSHAKRISALLIEFHYTTRRREEFCRAVLGLQHEFELVHLHGNNCSPVYPDGLPGALELTFVRKTGESLPKRMELPIDLDRPNDPGRPDCSLRFSSLRNSRLVTVT